MHTPDIRRVAAAVALSAMLAACGSSGGDDSPVVTPGTGSDVPSAAFESVAGLLAYVNELIAGTSETSEPVRLGEANLPVSDTTEPVN